MTNHKRYLVNSHKAISETLDGETIIINLETGSYYSMNSSGTALWHAIGSGKSIPATTPNIAAFLKTLEDDGIISEASGEGEEADTASFSDPRIDKYTDMQEMLLADPIHDVDEAGWPNLKKD